MFTHKIITCLLLPCSLHSYISTSVLKQDQKKQKVKTCLCLSLLQWHIVLFQLSPSKHYKANLWCCSHQPEWLRAQGVQEHDSEHCTRIEAVWRNVHCGKEGWCWLLVAPSNTSSAGNWENKTSMNIHNTNVTMHTVKHTHTHTHTHNHTTHSLHRKYMYNI